MKDLIHTAALIVIAFLLWKLLTKPEVQPVNQTTYHYDTTIYQIKINVPQPMVSVQTAVPDDVDTAAILARYFQIHYYRDTIADSNLTAIISDSIGFNRLLHRDFSYRITRPVEVHSQVVEKKRWSVSVGAVSQFDTVASFGVVVGLRYKDWEVIGGRNLTDGKYLVGLKKEIK